MILILQMKLIKIPDLKIILQIKHGILIMITEQNINITTFEKVKISIQVSKAKW